MLTNASPALLAAALFALSACTSAPPHNAGSATSSSSASSGAGGADAAAPPALRVLFIGNSYTYVNDLPGRVHALAASSGVATVDVDSVVVGGATLDAHVQTTGAMQRIDSGGFTHVVIQGQSLEPLTDPATFATAAQTLASEAKKVGALPVFYETWARKAGDAVYVQPWSGGSPAAMQSGLRDAYQKAAASAGGVVAPAGDAWEKALAEDPLIELFAPDGSHPSVAGTYLVGCVFHATLTGHSPVGIADRPVEITANDAAALQGVAATVTGVKP